MQLGFLRGLNYLFGYMGCIWAWLWMPLYAAGLSLALLYGGILGLVGFLIITFLALRWIWNYWDWSSQRWRPHARRIAACPSSVEVIEGGFRYFRPNGTEVHILKNDVILLWACKTETVPPKDVCLFFEMQNRHNNVVVYRDVSGFDELREYVSQWTRLNKDWWHQLNQPEAEPAEMQLYSPPVGF